MAMTGRIKFSLEDARHIGDMIGVDWSQVDIEQFRIGLAVELEHGARDPATDVTHDDPLLTGKIALAHLKELPDYYTRLTAMEAEAEGQPKPVTKILVIYASMFGHTKVLAEAIAEGAGAVADTMVVLESVDDVEPDELEVADGIIWGSSGIFGEPNPKMATFFSKLGRLWVHGSLQGKVGGVFATTSTPHYGLENILRALQTPMQHHGMIIVTNAGPNTPDRIAYGCPYGAGAAIPVESDRSAPMNRPREEEMELARQFGARVAQVARRLKTGR
jgi:NAD(P)H dehydrogenase (quinone)